LPFPDGHRPALPSAILVSIHAGSTKILHTQVADRHPATALADPAQRVIHALRGRTRFG
jgi:hypothetical protein